MIIESWQSLLHLYVSVFISNLFHHRVDREIDIAIGEFLQERTQTSHLSQVIHLLAKYVLMR